MKTIVTDLDGTLLVHGDIPTKTIDTLKRFQENGRLILASGRSLEHMQRFVEVLAMDTYKTGALIGLNGMEWYDFKTKTHHKEPGIDPALVLPLSRHFQNECALILVDQGQQEWTIKTHLSWLCTLNPWKRLRNMAAKSAYSLANGTIDKIILLFYIGSDRKLQDIQVRFPNLRILRVSPFWIEIIPKEVDKAKQVQTFIARYHIDPNDLYVFGDGENDMRMFSLTAHAYAPKSAMKKVKEKAHHICDAPEKEGVRQIVESLS